MKNLKLLNVQIRENSMENRRTYQIVKTKWKIMYIKCIDRLNLFKNSNLLKEHHHENSMENLYIRHTNRSN